MVESSWEECDVFSGGYVVLCRSGDAFACSLSEVDPSNVLDFDNSVVAGSSTTLTPSSFSSSTACNFRFNPLTFPLNPVSQLPFAVAFFSEPVFPRGRTCALEILPKACMFICEEGAFDGTLLAGAIFLLLLAGAIVTALNVSRVEYEFGGEIAIVD